MFRQAVEDTFLISLVVDLETLLLSPSTDLGGIIGDNPINSEIERNQLTQLQLIHSPGNNLNPKTMCSIHHRRIEKGAESSLPGMIDRRGIRFDDW